MGRPPPLHSGNARKKTFFLNRCLPLYIDIITAIPIFYTMPAQIIIDHLRLEMQYLALASLLPSKGLKRDSITSWSGFIPKSPIPTPSRLPGENEPTGSRLNNSNYHKLPSAHNAKSLLHPFQQCRKPLLARTCINA